MSRPVVREKFEAGEQVKWSSQAGGRYVEKTGVIEAVVPVGERPNAADLEARGKFRYGGGSARDHESYVVRVERKRGVPLFYWPVASLLQRYTPVV